MFFNNPIANFAQPIVVSGPAYIRNIVTDSLKLYLDASDTNSWPGSGTTWYDLSGNGFNFTLYNTWGTGGSGTNKYLSAVRASNNYAQNTSELANLGTYPEWTVQAILERTGVFNDQDFYSTNGIGAQGSTLLMSFSNQLRGHLWANGATNVLDSGTSFDGNKRAFAYQVQWSGNVQRDVFNGTSQSSSTLSGTRPTTTSYTATNLNTRDGSNGSAFQGYWYGLLVYNRYLSTTELGQNATAFGL